MKTILRTSVLFSSTLLGFVVEPSAKLFENDQVKVLRALEKAHIKGKFHEHKMDRVMIYLQPGQQRFEYQDGRKAEVFNWKAGEVKWSKPDGMHAPEVIGDESFNIVEVELNKPGTGKAITSAMDPVKIDPKHYHVEFENDEVRVVRVKIGSHEATPMHEHTLNRVAVYLTDQTNQITSVDGKVETVQRKAGEAVWATPTKHKEQNMGDKAFEIVMVEIKS